MEGSLAQDWRCKSLTCPYPGKPLGEPLPSPPQPASVPEMLPVHRHLVEVPSPYPTEDISLSKAIVI